LLSCIAAYDVIGGSAALRVDLAFAMHGSQVSVRGRALLYSVDLAYMLV